MERIALLLILISSLNAFAVDCTEEQIIFTTYSYPRYMIAHESYKFPESESTYPDGLICFPLVASEHEIEQWKNRKAHLLGRSYQEDYVDPYFNQETPEEDESKSDEVSVAPESIERPNKFNEPSTKNYNDYSGIKPLAQESTAQTKPKTGVKFYTPVFLFIKNVSTEYKAPFYFTLVLFLVFVALWVRQMFKQQNTEYKQCPDCGSLVKPGRSQCFNCGSYV